MDLVIRIQNQEIIGHPITKENFIQAYPSLNFNDPGPNFAKFNRIPQPQIQVYEVLEGCEYRWNNNIVEDYWIVRQMTNEEKLSKQNQIKQIWQENNGFQSWIFNEEICEFVAPIPYPNDGKKYIWNEESLNWTEVISEEIE
jgi:hypothetical protein